MNLLLFIIIRNMCAMLISWKRGTYTRAGSTNLLFSTNLSRCWWPLHN